MGGNDIGFSGGKWHSTGFKDSDDFDIYTCNQNESLNPLHIGKPYLLTETL